MCPLDNSHLTVSFTDHYVIKPTITFWGGDDHDYTTNNLGESGKLVDQGFEYQSGSNPEFLDIAGIRNSIGSPEIDVPVPLV